MEKLENLKQPGRMINLADIPQGIIPQEFIDQWKKDNGMIIHKVQPNVQKVKAVMDGLGYWFVIPADMLHDFIILTDRIMASDNEDTEAIAEFDDKFRKYYTGGDLNNVQLYAEL